MLKLAIWSVLLVAVYVEYRVYELNGTLLTISDWQNEINHIIDLVKFVIG